MISELNKKFDKMDGEFDLEDRYIFDFLMKYQNDSKIGGHSVEFNSCFGKSLAKLAQYSEPLGKIISFAADFNNDGQKSAIMNNIKKVSSFSLDKLYLITCDNMFIDSKAPIKGNGGETNMYRQNRWIHINGKTSGYRMYNLLKIVDEWLYNRGVLVIDNWNSKDCCDMRDAFIKYSALHPESFAIFMVSNKKAYICRPSEHPNYFYQSHKIVEFMQRVGFECKVYETNNAVDYRKLIVGQYNEYVDKDIIFPVEIPEM